MWSDASTRNEPGRTLLLGTDARDVSSGQHERLFQKKCRPGSLRMEFSLPMERSVLIRGSFSVIREPPAIVPN
jgi:hypothetical protein